MRDLKQKALNAIKARGGGSGSAHNIFDRQVFEAAADASTVLKLIETLEESQKTLNLAYNCLEDYRVTMEIDSGECSNAAESCLIIIAKIKEILV